MTLEQLNGLLRAVAAFLGGFLVSNGIIDASMLDAVVGAVVTLGAAVWSYFAKTKINA